MCAFVYIQTFQERGFLLSFPTYIGDTVNSELRQRSGIYSSGCVGVVRLVPEY